MRDDFSPAVKELLAKRVGYRCSNPDCRQPTTGPQVDPAKTVNVGVASHITAASADGPRYDSGLSPEQRRSSDNGIWLCQKCGKLVDNDPVRYPVDKVLEWKVLGEQIAVRELERGPEQSVSTQEATGLVTDLGDQLTALAEMFQHDLWRTKPQSPNYPDAIEALINSVENRLQHLRWKHTGSLLLPEQARSAYEGLLRIVHDLRSRKDDGVWYSGFTLLGQIRQVARLSRENM